MDESFSIVNLYLCSSVVAFLFLRRCSILCVLRVFAVKLSLT